MLNSVLVVCVGNICRSPVGERLLGARLRDFRVASAGINALEGHAADARMSEVARGAGLSLDGHLAQQFSAQLGAQFDLILVMEAGHKREILQTAPELSGRIMLFDHWTGADGIRDPYRQEKAVHTKVFEDISTAADAWAARLGMEAR